MVRFQQHSCAAAAWATCRMIAACALFLVASVSASFASQSRDLCETQWKDYVKIASSFHEKVKDTQSSIYVFSTKHGIIFNCLDTGLSEDFWEETRDFIQLQVSLIEELSKSDASMQAARDCGIWRREIGEKIQYEIYLPVDVKSDRTKACLKTIASTFEGFLTDINDQSIPMMGMLPSLTYKSNT